MSSIWDNTYTLGDSSATVISAGPGIKIDDSTPGVIKVSNDETVLWSGTYSGTSAIPFTESYKNFEYARIDFKRSDNLAYTQTFRTSDQTYNEIALMGHWCRINTAGGISLLCSQYTLNNDSLQWIRGCELGIGAGASNASANKIIVTQVVGINRISGGN